MIRPGIHLRHEQRICRMAHVAAGLAKRVRDRRLRQRREDRRELLDHLRHNESRRAPRVAGAVPLPLYRLLIEAVNGTIWCEQRRRCVQSRTADELTRYMQSRTADELTRYVQSRIADGTGGGNVGFASTVATCLLAASSTCDESSSG